MSNYPLFDTCHIPEGGRYRDPVRPDHEGLDFAPPDVNDPPLVPVCEDGRVIYAAAGAGLYGTTEAIVIIQHADYWSCYGHLRPGSLLVSSGEWVGIHEPLATMGYSGYTIPSGPGGTHVHIQMGPGTYHGHLSENPTFDPMNKLAQGGADEMTQEQADRYAQDLARSSIVSATWKAITGADIPQPELDKILGDMLLQHYWDQGRPEEGVNYVRAKVLEYVGDGNWPERTHTLAWFNHDPVQEERGYNTRAFIEYYDACAYPADQAIDIAHRHVAAGTTFSNIITSDMAFWRDKVAQAQAQQDAPSPLEDAGNKEKLQTAIASLNSATSNLTDLQQAVEGTKGGGS